MRVLRFDSEDVWVTQVARHWTERLRANPRLRLCLPAGNTPQKIFRAMGQSVAAGQVSFRDTEIFALDEYGGLAPGDEGRCARVLQRCLIDAIDLPPTQFHCLNPDAADLDGGCRDYDARIEPGFDLALLGIGQNGHLGLNEPGTSPDSLTHRVAMHASSVAASRAYVRAARLPTWGVTVGLRQLLAAKEVWLLASGSAKAAIVQRIVAGAMDPSVPASLLRRHANCLLWVDAEAGALLGTAPGSPG